MATDHVGTFIIAVLGAIMKAIMKAVTLKSYSKNYEFIGVISVFIIVGHS